jgi:hypothetical protein
MWLTIFNSLAPVIILIGLGVALRASGFLSAEFFAGMNKLCFWVGLPALLFEKIATTSIAGGVALQITLVLFLGMVFCCGAGYLAAFLLRLPSPSVGAFVQASFRGNLAYVGLPIVLYSLASTNGGNTGQLEAIAVLAFAPMVPIYNVVSVVVLSVHGKKDSGARWHELFSQVLTNPLIISCLLGFLFMLAGWPVPKSADRALKALGEMALPLTLLAIGASLDFHRVKGSLVHSVTAAFVKSALAPVAGVLLAGYVGLDAHQTAIALIYLACPTAVASYVMAEQLGADEVLAGSTVVVSTLLSLVPLAIVVGMAVK